LIVFKARSQVRHPDTRRRKTRFRSLVLNLSKATWLRPVENTLR
jgi:hypothetical protein